ncbi:MAG: HAD-IA family hydrolase [Anaerolineae bacterium]|nr:HAD-IA family hydrolase [Anaerolineae bacterium]
MIEAIVFDIGGVLAHDVWQNMVFDQGEGVLSRYHLEPDQVEQVGGDLWQMFAYRVPSAERDWKELELGYWDLFIKRLQLPTTPGEFVELTDRFIQPVEGMDRLLGLLQSKGIGLAVCSDNTAFWIRRQMDKLALHRFFSPDKVIVSSTIGVSKADPSFEMFQAAVNALEVDKESCIFVDDRGGNIQRALRFGLTGVLFPSHAAYGAQYLEALLRRMGVV